MKKTLALAVVILASMQGFCAKPKAADLDSSWFVTAETFPDNSQDECTMHMAFDERNTFTAYEHWPCEKQMFKTGDMISGHLGKTWAGDSYLFEFIAPNGKRVYWYANDVSSDLRW